MTLTALDSEDLLDVFRNMTLAELTAFRKGFEKAFGVSAAPVMTTPAPAVPDEEAPEEPTEFTVTLESVPTGKIQVIKAIRELTKLGLAEAKAFVESAPQVVLDSVAKDVADAAVAKLEAAGAVVTVTGQ